MTKPINVRVPDCLFPMFEDMDRLFDSFTAKHATSLGTAAGEARVNGQPMTLALAAWFMTLHSEWVKHIVADELADGMPHTDEDIEAAEAYAMTISASYLAFLQRIIRLDAMLNEAGVQMLNPDPTTPPASPAPAPTFNPCHVEGPSTLQ